MIGAISRLEDLLKRGRLDAALRELVDLFAGLENNTRLSGENLPFPQFDRVCEEIGRASAFDLFSTSQRPMPDEHDVVLITEATVQGGHAEIIRDIADCATLPLLVVATNLNDRKLPVLRELRDHPRVAGVVVCEDEPLLARLRHVQVLLANPAAKRVLVLCHGSDAVAIAAAAPIEDKPVLFFHHCDHTPCLGGFLRHAAHVDLHNLGFEQCRTRLGVVARYICLTSRDGAAPRSEGEYADPVFKSATCGGEHKLIQLRYPISYKDVVSQVIAERGGVHYHVGLLSDDFVASIRDALRAKQLPEDAFVHVGHVGGFREILDALEIDLYVPTLPQSGGKALVDAMSAGVPILAHENAIDRLWGGRDLIYPEAPSWSNLKELKQSLHRYDAAYWREQAVASRAYFERYHARTLFSRMLQANGSLPNANPPALKPYRPDFELWRKTRMLVANWEEVG